MILYDIIPLFALTHASTIPVPRFVLFISRGSLGAPNNGRHVAGDRLPVATTNSSSEGNPIESSANSPQKNDETFQLRSWLWWDFRLLSLWGLSITEPSLGLIDGIC